MTYTFSPAQYKLDHCTHLTWKLGHQLKWDHYKHPLLHHCVLCWGDLFSLDHVCGYQYALLKCQCVYGLYILAGLNKWDHCTHLTWNLGHRMKWDHHKHPLSYHFVLYWGWSFLIRLHLWVSIWAPKGSVCLWFVQFCLDRTSETIAGILLEN